VCVVQSFAMNTLIDELLKKRGIVSDEAREAFLHPDYDAHVDNPMQMKDMDKAVVRILTAIDEKECIAIYSDFDADGIPAGALLHDLFIKIGHERFINYIPHRNTEGYGFHKKAVKTLKEKEASLIITVDVGIVDIATTAYANKLGVDVIITDHHLPQAKLPQAVAVLDPQRVDETYPYTGLCGTGVAFKLAQAIIIQGRILEKEWAKSIPNGWEKWLLDLVAIATIADMVPLTKENRTLVHFGLLVLRKSRRPGVASLCKKLHLNQSYLSEDDIGFSIGPRINASSRMGSPETAFTLLTTTDISVAENCARELESLNNKRKGQVAQISKILKERFKDDSDDEVLVAGNPDWNPALLGLAANSLVDTYHKSVCLWGRDGLGNIKGSCRGDGETHIVELFRQAGNILTQFGGHEHAGGFALEYDNVHTLKEELNKAYAHINIKEEKDTFEKMEGDFTMPDTEIREMYNSLIHLAPFGIGNKKPVAKFNNVVVQSLRQFGHDGAHMELHIVSGINKDVRAIAFFKSPESFTCVPKEGSSVTLLCTLELSRFAGRTSFEVRIVDIV